jgi:hypothetical protein
VLVLGATRALMILKHLEIDNRFLNYGSKCSRVEWNCFTDHRKENKKTIGDKKIISILKPYLVTRKDHVHITKNVQLVYM